MHTFCVLLCFVVVSCQSFFGHILNNCFPVTEVIRQQTNFTRFTNHGKCLFHIPQCSIQNRNVHISVLNGALWDIEPVQTGICELVQLPHCCYSHGGHQEIDLANLLWIHIMCIFIQSYLVYKTGTFAPNLFHAINNHGDESNSSFTTNVQSIYIYNVPSVMCWSVTLTSYTVDKHKTK